MLGFRKFKTAIGRRSNQSYNLFHVLRFHSNPTQKAVIMTLEDDSGAQYSVVIDGDDVISTLRSSAINADCGQNHETHVVRSALET